MEINLRGGEAFWEQVIWCAENALRGDGSYIAPGEGGEGQDFRINFLPVDEIEGAAVAVIPSEETYGLDNWFGRADKLAALRD